MRRLGKAGPLEFAALVALTGLLAVRGDLAAGPATVVVTVQVQSSTGSPLPGALVSAFAATHGRPEFPHAVRLAGAVSDGNGAARLGGLESGVRCTLVVTPPDPRWKDFADLCTPDWRPADTTVKFHKAKVLRGVVHDPRLQPVPYATVHAQAPPWVAAVCAGPDGRFTFENAPPGVATIYAEVEVMKTGVVRTPPARAATDKAEVVLSMPVEIHNQVPVLLVRLFTPAGRPVAHGEATFYGKTTLRGPRGISYSTHQSGERVLGGAVRSSQIDSSVSLEVLGARTEFGERLPFGPGRGGPYGAGPREVRVQLPRELAVEGRVLGPDGSPEAGVRVQARPAGTMPGVANLLDSRAPHGEGISGPEGRFRVGGLEGRRYKIEARPTAEYVSGRPVEVPAQATGIELPLRRAARPVVTVWDDGGKPLPNAVIRLKYPSPDGDPLFEATERPIEARTNASGQVQLSGLDPQIGYRLSIYPPTERSELLAQVFEAWKPEETVVQLGRARSIQGVVRDQSGRAIPRARLIWAPAETKPGERKGALAAEAGAGGRFTLKELRDGSYNIWIRPPPRGAPQQGEVAAPRKVTEPVGLTPQVVPAGTQDAVLVLKMPSRLEFKIRGWRKQKPATVKALLVPAGARGAAASLLERIGKDGTVTFDDLRWNQTYSLYVGPLKDGRHVYAKALAVKNGRYDYTLAKGHTITGRVRSPPGTGKRKVWAAYPGFDIPGRLKSGGRFEIHGLPPGPWTLRASGRKGKTHLTGETRATVGDAIEVVLKPE